jgi:predicted amidohydrolase YtcJ
MSGPLREAHAHLVQHARAMSMLRLGDCTGTDDCLDRVARAVTEMAGADPGTWLLGAGLRVQAWRNPDWPTTGQLDAVTGSRPCCLWSFDLHALVANSAALARAGITPATHDPPNGRIVRDPWSREPTGLLLEAAAKQLWSAVPEPRGDERIGLVRAGLADLARHGFSEVHDLLSQPWLGPILADLDDHGELPVSVVLYPPLGVLDDVARTAGAWQRPHVRLGGGKVFVDGTLNARTAWMLSPYADPLVGLPCGQAMMTPAELRDAMRRVRAMGLGLAAHAIGDAAVRATLDAWEQTREPRRPNPGTDLRAFAGVSSGSLRIEHAELIDEADVPRFARLGVVCSVQPCHLLADMEALRRGLPHRLHRVLPLRELIEAGCEPGRLLWFGSDTPIVRPDPGDSIHAAVHRRRPGDGEIHAVAPEQAVTEDRAWAGFRPEPV